MSARLKDVAREAGVSVAAVSRFLNGRLDLPEATSRRIREAAGRLNYVPNALARRLSAGTSETIGLIAPDISYSFFSEIASAAEAEAANHGFALAIFNSRNELSREIGFLKRIVDRQIDGALFLTNHVATPDLAEHINTLGRVVLIDEDVPGSIVPRVFADNAEGGRLAGRHLTELGHRDIAFVGGPEGMISVEERLSGFRAALAASGIDLEADMVLKGPFGEQFGREAFETLFSRPRPPTAIFAGADNLAYGLIRAARATGVSIPNDLSIVSFDDTPLNDIIEPPLTAVRQSPAEFGRRGIRLLVDIIQGKTSDPEPQRIPVELIIRGSAIAPSRSRQ